MSLSTASLSKSPWLLQWLPILGIVAVLAHFFGFVASQAANIPFQDDIADFLQFIILVENTDSIQTLVEKWFEQYNDHRVGATRLMVYGAYRLEGEVNFHTLTLLANLALPLILMLFYICIREDPYRWIFLLISTLLLVNLRFYTITFMSQAAFAYYYVFLYAFACVIVLHKVTPGKLVLGAVLCTLSSFTLASGQAVWAIGLASLLHQSLLSGRKSLWYPLAWSLAAAAMLVVWRLGFTVGEFDIPAEKIRTMLPGYLGDATLLQALPRYATFFLAFTGSALIDFSVLWAAVAGGGMLALLVYLSFLSIRQDDIRLILCCWFAVATLAAVTVGRALLVAPDAILHARYNFFSVMLLCPLALLTLTRFAVFRTYAVGLVLILALVYSASTWRHSQELLQKELNNLYRAFNLGRYPVVGFADGADAIVKEAIALGIYHPPCRPFPTCETAGTPGIQH
jgi:hypothetical protein